jgi:hypothetical protein
MSEHLAAAPGFFERHRLLGVLSALVLCLAVGTVAGVLAARLLVGAFHMLLSLASGGA